MLPHCYLRLCTSVHMTLRCQPDHIVAEKSCLCCIFRISVFIACTPLCDWVFSLPVAELPFQTICTDVYKCFFLSFTFCHLCPIQQTTASLDFGLKTVWKQGNVGDRISCTKKWLAGLLPVQLYSNEWSTCTYSIVTGKSRCLLWDFFCDLHVTRLQESTRVKSVQIFSGESN